MKKELNKGITLIALIITIIVLLILAGITIAMVVGDNGIIAKAGTAKKVTNDSQQDEENRLNDYENKIETIVNGVRGEIKPVLLWTNPSPNSNFSAQTIPLDLSKYKYAIVVVKDYPPGDESRTAGIMKINSSIECSISAPGTSLMREFSATSRGVQISTAHSAAAASQSDRVIPLFIYGIENDLELEI